MLTCAGLHRHLCGLQFGVLDDTNTGRGGWCVRMVLLQSVKKVYIINAPFVFRGLWSMVKPWLHPNTQAAIEICSSNHLETFEENGISRESLPVSLGGTMSEAGELYTYFSAGCTLPKDLAAQRRQQQQGPGLVSGAARAESGDVEGLLPPAGHATGEDNHVPAHNEGLLPVGIELEPEPEPELEMAPVDGARRGVALELKTDCMQATGQDVDHEDPDSVRTPDTGYVTPQTSFHRQQHTEVVQQSKGIPCSIMANSNGANEEASPRQRNRKVSFGGWHQPPASADAHTPEVTGHSLGFGSPFAQPIPPLPSPVELLGGNGRAFAPEEPSPTSKRTVDSPRQRAPRRNRKQRGWGCCGAPGR